MAAPNLQTDIQNAIELLRVSTDKQDLARQRTDMKKLAARFPAVRTTRTLELVGVSGTAVLDNAEIQKMLADLADPKIHGIKISSIDRLMRPKNYETVGLFQRFAENGKVIWSQREGYVDPSTPEGFEVCMTAALRSGAEWRLLKDRSRDGRAEKLAEGKLVSPVHVYGYRYIPKHLKTDKKCERCATPNADPGDLKCGQYLAFGDQAKLDVVRRTFEARARRVKTYQLTASLNNAGIKSEKGGLWSRQTILQMLRNPVYNGRYVFGGQTFPCPKWIDDDLWARVQNIAEDMKGQWTGQPSEIYLLRNFIWCHRCGHRVITTRAGGATTRYYRCGHMTDHPPKKRLCPAKSVEQVALETAGWSAVWRVISNAAVLLQNAQSYYDALAAPSKNGLGKLRKEAASLDEDEKRLILMCKKRMITLEDAERDLAPIRSRRTQIETELKAAGQVFTLPTMRVAEAAVREIHAGPEPETYQERRPILEKILDLRMTFRDDNGSLDIEGRVPVDAQIMAEKKCNRRINGDDTSVLAIPFKIQAQVKAA